jgi:hypothetical protein
MSADHHIVRVRPSVDVPYGKIKWKAELGFTSGMIWTGNTSLSAFHRFISESLVWQGGVQDYKITVKVDFDLRNY